MSKTGKPRSRSKLRKGRRNWRNEADWTDSKRERRAQMLEGQIVVAKRSRWSYEPDACLLGWAEDKELLVPIHRPIEKDMFANPFEIGRDGDRDEVCEQFEKRLAEQPDLLERIPELKGKVLVCYCHPERCHGDHLARLANQAPPPASVLRTASAAA